MTFTQPVQNFWVFVMTYCVTGIVMAGLMVYLFGPLAGLLGGLVLAGGLLIVSLVGQSLFVPNRVRSWQVQTVSLQAWRDRNSNLDLSWVEAYTQTFQDLGFLWLQDYTNGNANSKSQASIKSIVRCFYHPSKGCLAEVGFIFREDGEVKISHTVFFSLFEQGWMLVDFNRYPNRQESLIYAWRNPRELRRYYPQFTIVDVFQMHLETSHEITESLNISVLPQHTWEMYQEIQQELVTKPWKRLRHRNLFAAMWDASQFERHPKYEWLVNYRNAKKPLRQAVSR